MLLGRSVKVKAMVEGVVLKAILMECGSGEFWPQIGQ